MKTKLRVAAVLATGLVAGCVSLQELPIFSKDNCTSARSYINAVQILDDAGKLSTTNSARFEQAKLTYDAVCSNPNPDADAVVEAARLYVVLSNIWRNSQ